EPQLPEWGQEAALPAIGSAPPDGQHGHVLRDDDQVSVVGQPAGYPRRALVPSTPEAVVDVSQVQLPCYPDYQALRVHHVRRVRGEEVVDALATAELRALQQENELKDSLFHGEETVVVILRDVRPGDIIDYGWTVIGENPVVGDSFAHVFYLGGHRSAAF